MLENFEKITMELDDYETDILLPMIASKIRLNVGRDNAIKSTVAVERLKLQGFSISGARWRKIIQYIRINGLVPNLIATAKGYYVSHDKEERERFLKSLHQRANSIMNTYVAMSKQHRENE